MSSTIKWLVVSDLYNFAFKTWFWDDHRFFNVDPLSSYIISGILVRQWAQSGRGGRSAFKKALENPLKIAIFGHFYMTSAGYYASTLKAALL